MKFIFFGTPDVAKETLQHLVENDLSPVAVVTNPDAPKGRGHIMTASPVKEYAQNEGLPILTPDSLNEEFMKEVGAFGADLAIVVAYGKILPEALINSFPQGVLNIHYSLLPRWRGAAPVEYALLNNDQETGVTIQKMIKELDAGDIVATQSLAIGENDTTKTLRPRLIKLGAELLVETLPRYLAGETVPTPQEGSEITFAPKLKKEAGEINLDDGSQLNWNKYRAFAVWPGTYFFKDGKRYKVTDASFKDGVFQIEKVIPEGGREIDWISV
ncbi:methionyl-tRNA formyltransferase [Candidatus Kaiserbacteria bacterium CG10_big_fil_rev_8_21_14_0_10_44_10]|uniref:Methionyl-tRNA formyltransferase n=1 Tax=Candidatus Kaiserbacteria bacterium CG10_big_fil_rev_8_21_14_0_10_44_10 TaxID=1974606 RepID=A0A2H0UHC9_9BACT|nr:MAG: methionyl-tRNA formyltransferase [Candidatus Kaiserbacteria bacterium CG10_big_fil_rev_8_21_14_0_10_44_10]